VGATAAERVEVWTALAEEQGVSLALASTGEHRALAVPGAVAQVLDNLLANALEVAPENSTVVVEVRSAGDAVELHVVDTGPGLQEEERARAFDRFWRGPSASEGGSGLGLAIVAQLAVASGGEASLAAAPTGGIDACVRLPACRARDHSETGR
jgi:signal transduction histidine kinase